MDVLETIDFKGQMCDQLLQLSVTPLELIDLLPGGISHAVADKSHLGRLLERFGP